MENVQTQMLSPQAKATHSYALGKAYEDCGDFNRAFEFYSAGAALTKQLHARDQQMYRRTAEDVISTFTLADLGSLVPSSALSQRSLFVTGLPRSGTTLTERILSGHSEVVDGAETNLFGAAILPTRGLRFEDALRYQQRSSHEDPWGEIGRDYLHLLDLRFRTSGLVVDKSLGETRLAGLILHALPNARIAWVRRSPEDVALSCFATYFDNRSRWSSSLTDIADHMLIEDRLFHHWSSLFPERILVVRYEELVRSPASWAETLQRHFRLNVEPGIEKVSRDDRAIKTASVSQVRQPISVARIGRAENFARHLEPFRNRYYR